MKKLIISAAILSIAISCSDSPVPKPDRLIAKDEMTNVLYDVALVQAVNSAALDNPSIQKIDLKEYLRKKYALDSATFVQNQRYYASDLESYQEMQQQIKDRLKHENSQSPKPPANELPSPKRP